jgi:carbon monoxide dehydrogenase subunit G
VRWLRIAWMFVAATSGLCLIASGVLYLSQPTSYRIARTRTIAAPPAAVLAQLSDLRAFVAWEPWMALPGEHPEVTFSPDTHGVGAWVERRVGSSGTRTTILEVASDRVVMSNATSGPLGSGASRQTFTLRVVPEGTDVTWALTADLHGLTRALWPFVHLEESVGPAMEAGLSRLDQASR